MRNEADGRRICLRCVALLCAGLLAAATASPAVAKKKHSANPLAGTWSATAEATLGSQATGDFLVPPPFSFRITKSGAVLGFAPTAFPFVNNDVNDWEFDPATGLPVQDACAPGSRNGTPVCWFSCHGLSTATVSAPNLRLSKPTASFPKGKKIDYVGPGGSPPGNVIIKGKATLGVSQKSSGALRGIFMLDAPFASSTDCQGGGGWFATKVVKKKKKKKKKKK